MLKHLTNDQLLTYYKIFNKCNKRGIDIKINSMDSKYAYHIIRLISEVEQILTEGTLILNEKGRREHMKAIRNGEWSIEQITDWFTMKELELEKLYTNCKILPHGPKENLPKIKTLLMTCLEMWYEDTGKLITNETISIAESKLKEIEAIISR